MERVETDYVTMWIEDGIMCCHYKLTEITLESARLCVEERHRLTRGVTYPFFSDSTRIVKMDKDARKYLSTGDGIKYLNAGAFLINNPITKIIGNFWVSIDKPSLPVRLFTIESEAKEWLQQYKVK